MHGTHENWGILDSADYGWAFVHPMADALQNAPFSSVAVVRDFRWCLSI